MCSSIAAVFNTHSPVLLSPIGSCISYMRALFKAIRSLKQLAGSRVPGVRNPRVGVLRERKYAP